MVEDLQIPDCMLFYWKSQFHLLLVNHGSCLHLEQFHKLAEVRLELRCSHLPTLCVASNDINDDKFSSHSNQNIPVQKRYIKGSISMEVVISHELYVLFCAIQ